MILKDLEERISEKLVLDEDEYLSKYVDKFVNTPAHTTYLYAKMGTGKTSLASAIHKLTNKKVILCEDTKGVINTLGFEYGVYKCHRNNFTETCMCNNIGEGDFILYDEIHTDCYNYMYRTEITRNNITYLNTTKAKVIVMTGTPFLEIYQTFGLNIDDYVKVSKYGSQTFEINPKILSCQFPTYLKYDLLQGNKQFVLWNDSETIDKFTNWCESHNYRSRVVRNFETDIRQTEDYTKYGRDVTGVDIFQSLADKHDEYLVLMNKRDKFLNMIELELPSLDILIATNYISTGVNIKYKCDRNITVNAHYSDAIQALQFGARWRKHQSIAEWFGDGLVNDTITIDYVMPFVPKQTVENMIKYKRCCNKYPFQKLMAEYSIKCMCDFNTQLEYFKEYGANIKDIETVDVPDIRKLERKHTVKDPEYKLTIDTIFGEAGNVMRKSEIISLNNKDGYKINLQTMNTKFAVWAKRNGFVKIK